MTTSKLKKKFLSFLKIPKFDIIRLKISKSIYDWNQYIFVNVSSNFKVKKVLIKIEILGKSEILDNWKN